MMKCFLLSIVILSLHASNPTYDSIAFLEVQHTPSYEASPSLRNWDLFGELLYWHTSEVGMIPSVTLSSAFDPSLKTILNLNNMNFDWNFGFRAGAKYSNVTENLWAFSLYYTWYRTNAEKSGEFSGLFGFPPGFPLTGTLSDAAFVELDWLFAAHKYKASWYLHYNLLDFEADHEFDLSHSINLRPYIGLRGGRINQDILIHSTYVDDTNALVATREKLEQHFWGLGPKCGLGSKWRLGNINQNSFYLFGDLSGSFLWSLWDFSDVLVIDNIGRGDLIGANRYTGSAVLQNFLGFEWDIESVKGNVLFSLRCTYESQYWFDHLQIFNSFNGRQHNALTLQGGTFEFRFNF